MPYGELKTALRIVWYVVSIATLGILLTPWVVTPERLAAALPACEWKARYHRECPFCGMTTAFFSISRGRLAEARRANRGSLPLYSALIVNDAAVLWFMRHRAAPAC